MIRTSQRADARQGRSHSDGGGSGQFARRLFAAAALAVALVALWYLHVLLLLIFAAILVALVLSSLSRLLAARTFLSYRLSLVISFLLIVSLTGGFSFLLGSQLRMQLVELWEQLPGLIVPLEDWLDFDAEAWLSDRAEAMLDEAAVLTNLVGLSSAAAGLLANIVLVVVGGVYFAFNPALYVGGFLQLFPPPARAAAGQAMAAIGAGLQWWLIGQFASMFAVGLLTYTGLRVLGVDSALALAVIAAAMEFVPFLGPILAAVPAIAIALAESPQLAIWVTLLYLVVQQAEGNLITPLIQQRSVHLAPAVTLFSILAFGILFGWLGILLATPLAVAVMIAVKQLWVIDVLHEETELPEEAVTDGEQMLASVVGNQAAETSAGEEEPLRRSRP